MHPKTLFLTLFFAFGPMVLLAEPSQSAAKTMEYMVKRGDCLWNISGKVLKDPFKWPLIYTANEGKIRNPNLIYPGQRFAIPPPSSITKASLREAARVAYARLAPIRGKSLVPKPKPVAREKSAPQISMGSAPKQEIPSASGQKASVPMVASGLMPVSKSPTIQMGMVALMILMFLLVVALVFLLWRKKEPGSVNIQEPQSLSFLAPPEEPHPSEAPMKTGSISSISMPSAPAQPEPKAPETGSSPSPEPSPAPPEAQVPAPPTDSQPPITNKPGDPPPPGSTHHAA